MTLRFDPLARPTRSQADLWSDSKTVRYELEMLLGAAAEYVECESTATIVRRNAYIESFALHCRALIFFLYGHRDGISAGEQVAKFSKHVMPSDVFATDFFPGWVSTCPPETAGLVESKIQADKHIAHITTNRREVNQPGSSLESVWKIGEVARTIALATHAFLQSVQPANIAPGELDRMKQSVAAWIPSPPSPSAVPTTVAHSYGPMPAPGLCGKTDARTISPHTAYNLHGRTG